MLKAITTILTLLSSFILPLWLEDGDGFLWKYEYGFLSDIKSRLDGIHSPWGYYETFYLSVVLAIAGQLFLIISLISSAKKNGFIKTGLIFLWVAFTNLLINSRETSLFVILLAFAIPFILLSVWLYWMARNLIKTSGKQE
jgi:hypothetical protein